MKLMNSLVLLLTGLLGGAGAAAYLLQKEPPPNLPASPPTQASNSPTYPLALAPPAAPPAAPAASLQELEQWKGRALAVKTQLKDMEKSLASMRDELAAVQGWQSKTPSLARLGQSLALLPAHKAAAADAAFAATRFPTVSADCQKLAIINGIGEVYEQRLYRAGIGSYWEIAHLSDADFQRMLQLSDWQMTVSNWEEIRARARQLAQESDTVGMLWEGETPDDFERIDGIGKMFELRLYRAGIRTYAALAATTVEELKHILGPMAVQPDVQQWIEQAKRLYAEAQTKG